MRGVAVVLTATVALALAAAFAQSEEASSDVTVTELLIVDKSAGELVRLDLASGEVTARIAVGFAPHEVEVVPASWSPTGGPLALVSLYGTGPLPGSSVALVDLETGAFSEVSIAPFTRPHGLAHVPGTRLVLVTAEAQDSLVVLELAPRPVDGGLDEGPLATMSASVPLGSRVPHMVVTTPDGSAGFASAITGGSVIRVELPELNVSSAAVGPGAEGIAVTADGAAVWVGSNGDHEVHVLDAATLEVLAVLPTCTVPIRVTAVGTDLMAVTCMEDAVVQLYDAGTRELMTGVTLPGGAGRPVGTLAAPDGTKLYVATTADGRVHEIDVASGNVVRMFDVGVEPDGLAFRGGP